MDPNIFLHSGQLWVLDDVSVKLYNKTYAAESHSDYSHCLFTIYVHRNPFYYIGTILLPMAALGVLQNAAVSFYNAPPLRRILPFFLFIDFNFQLLMAPEWIDRAVYCITVLLAFSILQTIIAAEMPQTSDMVLLQINISIQFLIGMILTIYCIFMSIFATTRQSKRKTYCNLTFERFLDLIASSICITTTILVNLILYLMMIYGK